MQLSELNKKIDVLSKYYETNFKFSIEQNSKACLEAKGVTLISDTIDLVEREVERIYNKLKVVTPEVFVPVSKTTILNTKVKIINSLTEHGNVYSNNPVIMSFIAGVLPLNSKVLSLSLINCGVNKDNTLKIILDAKLTNLVEDNGITYYCLSVIGDDLMNTATKNLFYKLISLDNVEIIIA